MHTAINSIKSVLLIALLIFSSIIVLTLAVALALANRANHLVFCMSCAITILCIRLNNEKALVGAGRDFRVIA